MDYERIVLRNTLTIDIEYPVIEGISSIVLEGEETEREIGRIILSVYNSRITDICEAADSISGSQFYLISNAVAHIPKLEHNRKVLTIEELNINTEFRAKGHGYVAINELLKTAAILSVDYIALKPAPPNDEASDDATIRNAQIKRLINFYERFGFQTYKVLEDEPIMVLDMKNFEYIDEF